MGEQSKARTADERAELIARNVAAAPPFSEATLEKLAAVLGPVAAEVRRRKQRGTRR